MNATRILDLTNSRAPTLGQSRLICIDGPAGSGKTTLAAHLAAAAPEAVVIHVDDLLDGWQGLPRVAEQYDDILAPLSLGRPGSYRRYDWEAGAFAETVTVPPTPLLILEGVGSGNRSHAARCTVLVWVEVDDDLRMRRGLARDGEEVREQWERWMREEREMFLDENTRARADVVV